MSSGAPLLVVGLDAGCPDLVQRWAADGTMPVLGRLAERGVTADLEGDELLMEHGMWLSLLSGRARGEIDRYSYRELDPGTYEVGILAVEPTPVPMLWEGPVGTGRRVVVLDVPGLLAQPELPAGQVAYWGVHDRDWPASAEPPELLHEITRLAPQMDIVRDHVETRDARADAAFHRDILESVRRRGAIARHLVARDGRPELAVVVFSETHTAGHHLWRHEHGFPDADRRLDGSLRDVYAAIDREIGLLAEALGGEPTP